MADTIFVTESDYDKLTRLIRLRKGNPSENEYLHTLEEELDRAEIIDLAGTPPDFVTIGSEVQLEDLDSGEVKTYRLTLPGDVVGDNGVSVLAPIGTALLGYRTGDVIEWRVPKGVRRLRILGVHADPAQLAATSRL